MAVKELKTRLVVVLLLLLVVCAVLSFNWAAKIRSDDRNGMRAADFGALYYGSRCVLEHKDPYNQQVAFSAFQADGGKLPAVSASEERSARIVMTRQIDLPTTFFVAAPLALATFRVALAIWLSLTAGLLVLAAFLVWDLSASAPSIAGGVACFMLLNSVMIPVGGNAARIVVSLCVIATWCLLRERHAAVGVVMLAVSLVVKPQDAGFVWLYFLLAGGVLRKRALQTLGVVGVLAICAAVWIAPISPQWIQELHRNLASDFVPGGLNDPGPSGAAFWSISPIISLQSIFSVMCNDPRFYNAASFIIVGGLILTWVIAVCRKRSIVEGARLALAAISALSLLPTFHGNYDSKLLLLTIPACAMLWADGGVRRWMALGLTSAAVFVTSDIPLIFWTTATQNVMVSRSTLGGKLTLLALHPAPLVLLATGCFYLWVYVRYDPVKGLVKETIAETWLDAALATDGRQG